jgi:EmrB/QacA subfamily drug resistance transporter
MVGGDTARTARDVFVSGATGWKRLLVEAARPARVRESPRAPWLLVGTVCIGAFMGQLDASIVTLALPTLREEFHTTLGAIEWVTLAYLVVLVGAVTVVGRLADITGRKLLYIYGFGLFTVGSILCGLAPSLLFLDAARVLQAVGAALLQANSVALITHGVPREKLGQAIGIQGGAQAVGLALGPAVGGALIGLGGWRLIFFVNVPAGIVGIVLGWFLLPRTSDTVRGERFDWAGAVLLMPAVGALMAALSFGREQGWGSPLILGLLASAALLVTAFAFRERLARHPIVPLELFKIHAFSTGLASGLLSYLVTFGVLFAVPFFLISRHTSPGLGGLELAVLPVALGIVAPFAGRLADAVGARPVTVAGMLVAAASLGALGLDHSSMPALLIELAGIGAGLGAFTPANNAAIMASAPRSRAGVAGGILNMSRGMGTSLGIALTGLVFSIGVTADRGLLYAGLFLALVSVVAALLASMRGPVAREHTLVVVE